MKNDPRKITKIIIAAISVLFLIGTFIPNASRCNVDSSEPLFGPALIQSTKCTVANDYTMFGVHAFILSVVILINIIALFSKKPKLELAFHGPVCIIATMQLCRFLLAIGLRHKVGIYEPTFFLHTLMLAAFTLFNANAFFINPIIYKQIKKSETHSWQKVLLLIVLPPLSVLNAYVFNSVVNSTALVILLAFVLLLVLFVLEFTSIFVISKKFTKIVAGVGLIIFTIESFLVLFGLSDEIGFMNYFEYGSLLLTLAADGLLIYDFFSQKATKKAKRKRIATTK